MSNRPPPTKEERLQMHTAWLKMIMEDELVNGPLVVHGVGIERLEVHRLDGNTMVARNAAGREVRVRLQATMGLTGARTLKDKDVADVWNYFGPSRHAVPGRPPLLEKPPAIPPYRAA